MGSINNQILLGTVATNAVGRSMAGGGMVANFRLRTIEEVTRNGEKKEFSEFHNVVVFGPKAETAREYKEGDEVYAEGRTKTRKYQHNGQDRYITEVVVYNTFRVGEQSTGPREIAPSRNTTPPSQGGSDQAGPETWDDDRPF